MGNVGLLGGTAKNVFQRVVQWGDGWFPNRSTAADMKRGRETLNELAAQTGRDPRSIEVVAFGGLGQFREREAIAELEEAGVNGVTIWLTCTEGDEAIAEMEEIAAAVLA